MRKPREYKYISYLTALYLLLFMFPSIFLKKVVVLPFIGTIPVSILCTGFYFILLDVIAEVYGYYEARKVLFSALFAYVFYVVVVELVINLHSPKVSSVSWSSIQDPNAYVYIFDRLYLFGISVFICGLFGNTFNLFVLTRWKILLKGRLFWVRSVVTSGVTAAFYSFVSMFIVMIPFFGKVKLAVLFKLMFSSFCIKIITLAILAYPSTFLCIILKHLEGVDVYDLNVTFNPFKGEGAQPLTSAGAVSSVKEELAQDH